MRSTSRMLKPNAKTLIGIFWIILAVIYISDKVINHLQIRLLDWICWVSILIAGVISINEGIRDTKKSSLNS
ncbi:MAG TPA: hypothetical protein VNV85_09955 [Puia sp.]|jgi:hypothetical protein|nr:hypothetical protein [Puia sp.]